MLLSDLLERKYLPRRIGIAGGAYNLRRAVALYSSWLGRSASVSDLEDDSVSCFLAARASHVAAPTVNGERSKLLALWRFAYDRGLLESLPRSVAKAKEFPRVPAAWTAQQVEALVQRCAAMPGRVGRCLACDWWPALVLSIYWTASRPKAILDCRPEDYDSLGWLTLRKTKSGRPKVCPLPASLCGLLDRIRDASSAALFVWPHGRRYLWTKFRRIVERIGLPAPRTEGRNLFYRLRRTAISYAWAASQDDARILAGHRSTATTERHYVDPRIAGQRRIIDVLPNIEVHDTQRQLTLF